MDKYPACVPSVIIECNGQGQISIHTQVLTNVTHSTSTFAITKWKRLCLILLLFGKQMNQPRK